MMPLHLLKYMFIILEALKIWIYVYHGALGKSIEAFLHKGSTVWNELPSWMKVSTSFNDFMHNHRHLNRWILPDLSFYYKLVYILPILSFYHAFLTLVVYSLFDLFKSESFLGFIMLLLLLYIIYIMITYICVLCIYIFYFVTGHHGRTVYVVVYPAWKYLKQK